MEFTNNFQVPLPPDEAWAVLLDIERIAPCMPGAELTEIVDKETYKGKVSVRLGPVALIFTGEAKFEEVDDANHKARVKAQGRDSKGRGGANAIIEFQLEPVEGGSAVEVHADLTLSGSIAQYGRGAGMIQEVASHIIGQFTDSLKAQITESGAAPPTSGPAAEEGAEAEQTPPAVKSISGFTLMFKVLWNAILRLFPRRLG